MGMLSCFVYLVRLCYCLSKLGEFISERSCKVDNMLKVDSMLQNDSTTIGWQQCHG